MPQSVTERWLTETHDDLWTLTSKQFAGNFPYAFIANGYIGQQISPEGEGMLISQIHSSRSGCLIHGVYSQQKLPPHIHEFATANFPKDKPLLQESLAEIPLWNTLSYCDGVAKYERNNGKHENYQQSLDLKTATITTKDRWTTQNNKITELETKTYLSYSNKNLAVITTTITPSFSGEICFDDNLDASMLDNINKIKTNADDLITLTAKIGSHQHEILLASKLILPKGIKKRVKIEQNKKKISRKVYLYVASKQSITITKLVGIYANQDQNNMLQQAKNMLEQAANNLADERKNHEDAWRNLWKHRIEITGADGLQKILNAVLYQLYAQLRIGTNWSLGPTGISGSMQWAGIIFWDADLWIGPPITILNPKLARCIYQYRHKTLDGAKRNAKTKGYCGTRYAWESTQTGDETCFAFTAEQDHIVSDIALTQWQYCLISGDENYRQKAEEVILSCAKYWEHRIIFNKELDRYEIRDVCCADENSGIVNNNSYTNYSAVKTLEIAGKILQRKNERAPRKWQEICRKMFYPYDEQMDLFLEHDNYRGETIKQADVALLVYPYEMPMSKQQKDNIVNYYRKKYPHEKIMMSSAFDGIIYCEQQEPEKAWHTLLDQLPHFLGPFLLVSETPTNNVLSFLTGLGGILQLIINGFVGLRIKENGLLFNPCLPKEISGIKLIGIHYNGTSFDAVINKNEVITNNFSKPKNFEILG